ADMIYKPMEIFDIKNAKDVVKVGDSIIDIEEGKTANCGIIVGVTTGAHTEEQLKSANPTHIINSLIELTQILF
ncbi:MAG: HAD hydrolase-like protein, partial [Lutibacter sp.]|nr:HAD hydrolase-like protein [Lutibacter sp.]